MYQMKKCVKCNSENIEVGTLGGPAATMALSGIEDWLSVYTTYTCKDCGYTETTDYTKADVIVFNTCCIRKAAEQKAEGNIGALKQLKKKK